MAPAHAAGEARCLVSKAGLSPGMSDVLKPVRHKSIKWWQLIFLQNVPANWSRSITLLDLNPQGKNLSEKKFKLWDSDWASKQAEEVRQNKPVQPILTTSVNHFMDCEIIPSSRAAVLIYSLGHFPKKCVLQSISDRVDLTCRGKAESNIPGKIFEMNKATWNPQNKAYKMPHYLPWRLIEETCCFCCWKLYF